MSSRPAQRWRLAARRVRRGRPRPRAWLVLPSREKTLPYSPSAAVSTLDLEMEEQTTMIEEQTTIEVPGAEGGPRRATSRMASGSKGSYAVRKRELRRKRNGDPWLATLLGDAPAPSRPPPWRTPSALYGIGRPGSPIFVAGVFEVSERWGAKIKLAALRAPTPTSRPRGPAPDSRRLLRAPGCATAPADRDHQDPSSREPLDLFLRRGLPKKLARSVRRRRRRFYHQADRHDLLQHTLTVAQAVGCRQLLPRHRPLRRRRRRPPPRHRQDRGLQRRPAGDRPHRCGPPAGRDPARLLPGAPPSRR